MFISFVLIFLLVPAFNTHETELKLQDRVRYLKENLQRELRSKHRHAATLEPVDDFKGSYELDDAAITPIMEHDEFKKDDKFKLRRLKTTTLQPESSLPIVHRKVERKPKQKALRIAQDVSKPLDIFYRKAFSGTNTPIAWLHCSETISPYLQGAKKEMTRPGLVDLKDHVVMRLSQLLQMNTTALNKDEVYSILYQISKLKIRLWSWSIPSLRLLFNVLTRSDEKHHSFRSLKRGLKALFEEWRLDRSNTTRLLLQARVFRPPCMVHKHAGSSKLVRGSTISVKTSPADSQDSGAECNNGEHRHG